MFQVKICGVTRPEDARIAAEAGADAIGLNFYPGSPRHVSIAAAAAIVAELPRHVRRVGVFVNTVEDEICRVFDQLQLDAVQLHGDEPPEFIQRLGGRPVLKAFRMDQSGLAPVFQYLQDCRQIGCVPAMILVEGPSGSAFGGTGQAADWKRIAAEREMLGDVPLVLAGGLRADNVTSAIATVRPDAVDTASGVESEPGIKDARLIDTFVRAAREAFAAS